MKGFSFAGLCTGVVEEWEMEVFQARVGGQEGRAGYCGVALE